MKRIELEVNVANAVGFNGALGINNGMLVAKKSVCLDSGDIITWEKQLDLADYLYINKATDVSGKEPVIAYPLGSSIIVEGNDNRLVKTMYQQIKRDLKTLGNALQNDFEAEIEELV